MNLYKCNISCTFNNVPVFTEATDPLDVCDKAVEFLKEKVINIEAIKIMEMGLKFGNVQGRLVEE